MAGKQSSFQQVSQQHHIRAPWRPLYGRSLVSVWSLSICSLEGTVPGPLHTQDLPFTDSSQLYQEVSHYFPGHEEMGEKEVKSFASKCNIQDLRLHSMNQRPLSESLSKTSHRHVWNPRGPCE